MPSATAPTTSEARQFYYEIEQGTDEWHALRRGLITASTIDSLLTATGKPANNETSRRALYRLLAERITNRSDPSFYSDDMARGHLLEPYARDLYAAHYGEVQECGFITAHLGGVVIGYSPDGLVGADGLIEIKSPRMATHIKSLLTNQVPSEYISQVQTGLAVADRQWCDFISYCPGLPLFVKRCVRDEPYISALINAAQAAEEQLAALELQFEEASQLFFPTQLVQLEPSDELIV